MNTRDMRNDHEKRVFWKMCRVLELLQGKDGIVRAAKVQVVSTDGKKKKRKELLQQLILKQWWQLLCKRHSVKANSKPTMDTLTLHCVSNT